MMRDPYEDDVWPLPRYSGDSKVAATFHPGDGLETPQTASRPGNAPEAMPRVELFGGKVVYDLPVDSAPESGRCGAKHPDYPGGGERCTWQPPHIGNHWNSFVGEWSADTERASGALVERLAEAMCAGGAHHDRDWAPPAPLAYAVDRRLTISACFACQRAARAVLPLVEAHAAAEVEAAVTATRAEVLAAAEEIRDRLDATRAELAGMTGMRNAARRRAEAAESERDALREKVTRVEALRDEWAKGAAPNFARVLSAALSDPTTPDQPEERA